MLLFYGMALSINAYTMDPTHRILKPYSWEAPSHDFQLARGSGHQTMCLMFETLVADFDLYNLEGLCSGKAYM